MVLFDLADQIRSGAGVRANSRALGAVEGAHVDRKAVVTGWNVKHKKRTVRNLLLFCEAVIASGSDQTGDVVNRRIRVRGRSALQLNATGQRPSSSSALGRAG